MVSYINTSAFLVDDTSAISGKWSKRAVLPSGLARQRRGMQGIN